MKKLLTILTILLIFTSCGEDQILKSNNFELRQLVQHTEVTENTHGYFFLFFGEYSSSTNIKETVRMFANIDGYHQFIEADIKRIKIKIDNTVEKPHIYINYNTTWDDVNKPKTNNDFFRKLKYSYHTNLIIVCPEQYLPEKLTSIKL